MKRGKKLLILLLIMVLLGSAALLATKLAAEREAAEATAEEDTGVTIYALNEDALLQMSWTHEGETLTFDYDETAVGDAERDTWIYTADPSFPVNTTNISAMMIALNELVATKSLEAPEDLGEFGLAEPACTVTVVSDTTTVFLIGDETSLGGQRYLSMGDGKVYLVDAAILETFSHGLYDLVDMEIIPTMTTVNRITVETAEQTLTVEARAETVAEENVTSWYSLAGGQETALDADLTGTFSETISGLTWESCVDYKADEAALEACGLLAPAAVVTVDYTASTAVETGETDENGDPIKEVQELPFTFIVEVGANCESGYYARLPGSAMVYIINAETAEAILLTTEESLTAAE